MQNELRSEYPDKPIQIAGVNEFGHDSGNPLMVTNRSIPVLQDTDANDNGASDVWYDNWDVTYRDVKIVNQQNELVGTLNLTPPNGFDLGEEVNYDALKQILVDVAHQRPLWQNPDDPTDVNGDQRTSAVDALQCINELMLGTVSGFNIDLPLPMPPLSPTPYLDVNGDGKITAVDALRVINRLIEQSGGPEGESIVTAPELSVAEGESVRDPVTPPTINVSKVTDASGEPVNNRGLLDSIDESTTRSGESTGTSPSTLSRELVDNVFRSDADLLLGQDEHD